MAEWLPRYQAVRVGFPVDGGKGFYPIPPQGIPLPNSNPILLRLSSVDAEPHWWLAGYLAQLASVGDFYPQVYWRKIPLGNSYFQLQEFGACDIVIKPARWFGQMSIEVLQSDTPAAPLIPLPLPTPLPVPIPLPPYLP